jgi:hypothetical protein
MKDLNYGYPIREGPCCYDKTSGCKDTKGYTNPIHFYTHVNMARGGGAITAGAFILNDVSWPSKFYNGHL